MQTVIDLYLKNSNTGEMIKKVVTTSTWIKGIPDRFYDVNGQPVSSSKDLTGFVAISEKKFSRESKKTKNKWKQNILAAIGSPKQEQ